ncbi:MAG: FtsX-like permease family protein [Pirellulales bacterium]
MNVLDIKLLRDLWSVKGLLITIVAILGLGVSAYLANFSLYFNLELSRQRYYSQCRMADFWVDIHRLPQTEVDRLAEVPGISELRARIWYPVVVDLESEPRPLSGVFVSLPAEPAPVINGILLKSGSYFSREGRDEVILNDAFARARNLRVGDMIRVIVNDRQQPLRIVGTAISSEFVFARPPGAMIPDKAGFAVMYLREDFAEEITNLQGAANQLVGLLAPDARRSPASVLKQLESRLEPFGEATSTKLADNDSHAQLRADLDGLRSVNLIVPTVFLAVAALILDVLMVRIAQQQRTSIGALKALGYTNLELMSHFLKLGLTIGLLGGLAGTAFGIWLTGVLLNLFQTFYEFPRLVNRPYPVIAVLCVLLSALFAMLGTLRGVWQVMRLHPAEAMRPKPPEASTRFLLEAWPSLWQKLDFRWQMVVRGLIRQRLRTFTGLFASTMGAALILQTLQMNSAFAELIDFTFERMLRADFELTFKEELDYGAVLDARRLPGVDYVEPSLVVGCTFQHQHREKKGSIIGIARQARLTQPRDLHGKAIVIPEHGIVLTRELSKRLGAKIGDRIHFTPLKGRREPVEIEVVRIVESYVGAASYADLNFLNSLVGEQDSVTRIQAEVHQDPETVRAFYAELKQLPRLQGFSSLREQKVQLMDLLKPIYTVNMLLIAFAGLLFCGSMITASLISLAERRQELATLRVLGYRPGEIGSLFLRESLLINSIGILLGLPVGYEFARFVNHAVATETTRLPFVVHTSSIGWTVALGFLFTFVAYIPVARAVRKMDWCGAINVKE